MRIRRSIHERLAGLHTVALVDADVLAARDQVLLGLAVVGANDDLPHALDEATHLHAPVDLGDDRLLLRLARLEQLGHPRQTPGDVLGLGGLARDLRDDVGREDVGAVGDVEVGAHRERIAVPLGARRLRRVDDDAGLQASSASSMMTLRARPVTSSNSSRTVTPSTMSWYCTLPVNSVRIGLVNGSHSTRTVRALTRCSGLTFSLAPYTTG